MTVSRLTEVNGPVAIQENLFGRVIDDDIHVAERRRPEEVMMTEILIALVRIADAPPPEPHADDRVVPAEPAFHANLEVTG
jgi:hypothetical protein